MKGDHAAKAMADKNGCFNIFGCQKVNNVLGEVVKEIEVYFRGATGKAMTAKVYGDG